MKGISIWRFKYWGASILWGGVISVPVLFGCAPLVFMGVNTEPLLFTLDSPDTLLPPAYGERWHGAIIPGEVLKLYSDTLADTNEILVYDPLASTPNCYISTRGASAQRAAEVVRDYLIDWDPAVSAGVKRTIAVQWSSADTRYIVYEISIPGAVPPQWSPGTLHRIQLYGTVTKGVRRCLPSGYDPDAIPTMIVRDSTGATIWQTEGTGRVVYIRQGVIDSEPPYIVDVQGMSRARVTPLPKVTPPITFTIHSTEVENDGLGYAAVALAPALEESPGVPSWWCYDLDRTIRMRTTRVEREVIPAPDIPRRCPEAFTWCEEWRYTFEPLEPLVANWNYAFIVGWDDLRYFGSLPPTVIREQRMTQDMNWNLISDPAHLVEDVGNIACPTRDMDTIGYVYYFQDPNGGAQAQWPPLPPGASVRAELTIKPEVFNQNTGVFTAFVSFPMGEDADQITEAYCNGAKAFKKIYKCEDNDVEEEEEECCDDYLENGENHSHRGCHEINATGTSDAKGCCHNNYSTPPACTHVGIFKFQRNEMTHNLRIYFGCWGYFTDGRMWFGYDTIKRYVD